jgi:primosomal protein N' (replication factor Y)
VVLHSRQTPKKNKEIVNQIINGQVKIVLATRLALFLNFKNLGMIIVHDEHHASYKQENHPRYHAVDVAIHLAKAQNIKLLLTSKSPRLETKFNKEIECVSSPESPQRKIALVDLKKEEGSSRLFSEHLQKAIKENLEQGKQVVLFQNRRGMAHTVMCLDCHERQKCTTCGITLSLHQNNILKCHYCLFEMPCPSACPKCGSLKLRKQGAGTEKIESELKRFFKEVKVLRLDRDVAKKKGSEKLILDEFNGGAAHILTGTQMLAKEYDFKNVGLVAVLNADTDYYLPDFRSSEKTFARLTDLIHLAGASAQVVIQTYQIDQRAIQLAVAGDYETFYQEELLQRKSLGFPPYSNLTKLVAVHKEEAKAHQLAKAILSYVTAKQILGPVEAPMAKLRGKFRVMVILKEGVIDLKKIPSKLLKDIEIDVDPQNLL